MPQIVPNKRSGSISKCRLRKLGTKLSGAQDAVAKACNKYGYEAVKFWADRWMERK